MTSIRHIGWLMLAVFALACSAARAQSTGDLGSDRNPKYELIPMSGMVFRLDGLETFRIRFEIDERGKASKITGLYMDGSSDETPRTP